MMPLPIVVRELRVVARGGGFYLKRVLTALACIGFWGYLLLVNGAFSALGVGGSGQRVFNSLGGLALFYCIILARNTADCVSEEKRDGTLGLLFLTDLKGYDIALGKLCANSVRTFYGLLSGVPVACCAFVMGGVTGSEVWRTVLALLNVFFFSHVTGLLVSTLSRDARRANGGTAFMLVMFFIGIPLAESLTQLAHSTGPLVDTVLFLQQLNPAHAFSEATAVGTRYGDYWRSLLEVNLLSWLFLALASFALPRSWQDKPVKGNTPWNLRVRQWCFGSMAFRKRLRARLIAVNPFLWLVSRNQFGQILVWALLGLLGCGWYLICVLTETHMPDVIPIFVMAAILNHSILKFWIASEACTHLGAQRRSGALEYLLACTPLSPADIIRGQWLALRRRFLWPLVAVLVVDLLFIVVSLGQYYDSDKREITFFVSCMVAGMVMLVADALAIGHLGMWRAMLEKKPNTAAGATAARLLVLPWMILGVLGPLRLYDSGASVLMWWLVLGLGIDAGFAIAAENNLSTRFREQAALRPEETLGLMGRLGRALGRMSR